MLYYDEFGECEYNFLYIGKQEDLMYYVKIVTNVTMVTCSNNSGNEEEVKRIDEWRNLSCEYCTGW